jgi:cytochrome P450
MGNDASSASNDAAIVFDPLIPDTEIDVHALYATLRSQCPVIHSDRWNGFWALTRYEDVVKVLTDSQTFITSVQNVVPKVAFTGRRPPLHLDPPEHTPYRRALNHLVLPERVAALEPAVRKHAIDYLEPLVARGYGDFGKEFAYNYPILAFSEFLHVSPAMIMRIRAIGERYNHALQEANDEAVKQQSLALYEIARELIALREAEPADPRVDPTSSLLAVRVNGEPLPRDMIIGTVRQVLVVGIIAPTVVLGSMVVHLARDPQLQQQLRHEPDLIPAAIEELLRLYSPYRGFARTATHDVTLGNQHIKKGEPIAMIFTSANRDESVFEQANEFRLHRPVRHIAFGLGVHKCPGAPYARMELRVALEELLSRTTGFELTGPLAMTRWPEYGVTAVPLRFF